MTTMDNILFDLAEKHLAKLPKSVKKLYRKVADHEAYQHLVGAEVLYLDWPDLDETLQEGFESFDSRTLARSVNVIYQYGRGSKTLWRAELSVNMPWSEKVKDFQIRSDAERWIRENETAEFVQEPKMIRIGFPHGDNGAYWKFRALGDRVLSERVMINARKVAAAELPKNAFHFRIRDGWVRAYLKTHRGTIDCRLCLAMEKGPFFTLLSTVPRICTGCKVTSEEGFLAAQEWVGKAIKENRSSSDREWLEAFNNVQ